jgi:hypothetical protein
MSFDVEEPDMRIPSRGWRVAIAGVAALALVLVGTGAYALGTRRQGVPQKLYVVSTQDFSTNLPSPVEISDLLVTGTWKAGDLLVARLDAQTTCTSSAGNTVAGGSCRVAIDLTGPDEDSPSFEFDPQNDATSAMDSVTTPATTSAGQEHALTRHILVPRVVGAKAVSLPLVMVTAWVSDPGITFTLHQLVITVEVVQPTAS